MGEAALCRLSLFDVVRGAQDKIQHRANLADVAHNLPQRLFRVSVRLGVVCQVISVNASVLVPVQPAKGCGRGFGNYFFPRLAAFVRCRVLTQSVVCSVCEFVEKCPFVVAAKDNFRGVVSVVAAPSCQRAARTLPIPLGIRHVYQRRQGRWVVGR